MSPVSYPRNNRTDLGTLVVPFMQNIRYINILNMFILFQLLYNIVICSSGSYSPLTDPTNICHETFVVSPSLPASN